HRLHIACDIVCDAGTIAPLVEGGWSQFKIAVLLDVKPEDGCIQTSFRLQLFVDVFAKRRVFAFQIRVDYQDQRVSSIEVYLLQLLIELSKIRIVRLAEEYYRWLVFAGSFFELIGQVYFEL